MKALRKFSHTAAAILLSASILSLYATPTQAQSSPILLRGQVDVTNFLQEAEQTAGLDVDRNWTPPKQYGGLIKSVKQGSPAALNGVKSGDKLLYEKLEGGMLTMLLQRNGKTYEMTLKAKAVASAAIPSVPMIAPSPTGTPLSGRTDTTKAAASLAGNARTAALSARQLSEEAKNKLIAEHDVAILIDKSASMYTPDAEGLSRWDWCAMESQKFTRLYNDVARRKLTVILFDGDHNAYNNVSFSDIPDIFGRNTPGGSTNTAGALGAEIESLFGHVSGRPMVIAVITDGAPDNQQAVRDVIIKATKRMRYPGELVISFLQVGQDSAALSFLSELDNKLTAEGATADIVSLHNFEQLKRLGLRDAMVDAILETESGHKSGS